MPNINARMMICGVDIWLQILVTSLWFGKVWVDWMPKENDSFDPLLAWWMKNVLCVLGLYTPNLEFESHLNCREIIIWHMKGIGRRRLAAQIGDFGGVFQG